MKIIRVVVGFILTILDKLTSPAPIKIESSELIKIQEKSKGIELYQFSACPFCIKVRRYMKKNNISLPLRDAKNDEKFRQELLDGGGRIKAPCLKITNSDGTKWLYESDDIILFFEKNILA